MLQTHLSIQTVNENGSVEHKEFFILVLGPLEISESRDAQVLYRK